LGYRFFDKKVRTVTLDPKTGLLKLTVRWSDPALAAEWANGLVRAANEYLRDKALREAERNIDYLKSQAASTDFIQLREAGYSLMLEELNKAMMARGNEEYAFKVLDPAQAPEEPASLKWPFWTLIGLACGLLVSVFIVLLRLALREPKDTSDD
jgi:uncharacterized protein involved in exopolysaccharide biosynthesis